MWLVCKVLGAVGAASMVEVDASDPLLKVVGAVLRNGFNGTRLEARDLKLFLAREADGRWVHFSDHVVRELHQGVVPGDRGARRAERARDQWASVRRCAAHGIASLARAGSAKRAKVPGDAEQPIEYFEMRSFPPMADRAVEFPLILVRSAYKTIYDGVMAKMRDCQTKKRSMNIVGTGSPGVGTSRFYLYMIWRITSEFDAFPGMTLVTNYKDKYWRFRASRNEFVVITNEEVEELKTKPKVLRLIEAGSNDVDKWSGVSVLFSSFGMPEIKYFRKKRVCFIMPPWSKVELEAYNGLLSGWLRLSPEKLEQRFKRFGGIAQCVFADPDEVDQYSDSVDEAIASNDALTVIKAGAERNSLDTGKDLHRLLVMVPSTTDCKRHFHLEFVSMEVAKAVVDKAQLNALDLLSQFATIQREGPATAVARGYIHGQWGHRRERNQSALR